MFDGAAPPLSMADGPASVPPLLCMLEGNGGSEGCGPAQEDRFQILILCWILQEVPKFLSSNSPKLPDGSGPSSMMALLPNMQRSAVLQEVGWLPNRAAFQAQQQIFKFVARCLADCHMNAECH